MSRAENGAEILERRHPDAVHFYGAATTAPPSFADRASVPGVACRRRTERWSRDFREVTCDVCRMSAAFRVARAQRNRARVRVVVKAEGVSLEVGKAVLHVLG